MYFLTLSFCLYSFPSRLFMFCFLFYGYGDPRDLHGLTDSVPTRRSSDLIANRSSGRQGFAIAGALAAEGAAVTLIAGPVTLDTPVGVERVDVETAQEMANAVAKALPADAAVLVAAVAEIGRAHV